MHLEKLAERSGLRMNVLRQICELAKRNGIRKVLLFGSRGRGDFKKRSDIDLAVLGGNVNRFRLELEEETDTLLKYDVVDMNHRISPALQEILDREGVSLYEEI